MVEFTVKLPWNQRLPINFHCKLTMKLPFAVHIVLDYFSQASLCFWQFFPKSTNEQWKKPWLFRLYKGLSYPAIWVFPKIMGKPPKSSILIGFSIINHPFWGTTIFGNIHIGIIMNYEIRIPSLSNQDSMESSASWGQRSMVETQYLLSWSTHLLRYCSFSLSWPFWGRLVLGGKKTTPFWVESNHWVVVSNIFYFHPYLGKIPILTNIFQRGWNHQVDHLERKVIFQPSFFRGYIGFT